VCRGGDSSGSFHPEAVALVMVLKPSGLGLSSTGITDPDMFSDLNLTFSKGWMKLDPEQHLSHRITVNKFVKLLFYFFCS
jgi:hypothetical protein